MAPLMTQLVSKCQGDLVLRRKKKNKNELGGKNELGALITDRALQMDRALQIHVDTEEKYARSMLEEEKEKRK